MPSRPQEWQHDLLGGAAASAPRHPGVVEQHTRACLYGHSQALPDIQNPGVEAALAGGAAGFHGYCENSEQRYLAARPGARQNHPRQRHQTNSRLAPPNAASEMLANGKVRTIPDKPFDRHRHCAPPASTGTQATPAKSCCLTIPASVNGTVTRLKTGTATRFTGVAAIAKRWKISAVSGNSPNSRNTCMTNSWRVEHGPARQSACDNTPCVSPATTTARLLRMTGGIPVASWQPDRSGRQARPASATAARDGPGGDAIRSTQPPQHHDGAPRGNAEARDQGIGERKPQRRRQSR